MKLYSSRIWINSSTKKTSHPRIKKCSFWWKSTTQRESDLLELKNALFRWRGTLKLLEKIKEMASITVFDEKMFPFGRINGITLSPK
jgi:hypothetical protein